MTLGKNTIQGEQLLGFIARIEANRKKIKALQDDNQLIFAEAATAGLPRKHVAYCIKIRGMKPHDFMEAREQRDLYEHAIGMGEELPLFRQLQAVASDKMGRDQLVETFKAFAPQKGSITVEFGDQPIKIWRDKQGKVHAEPVEPVAPPSPSSSIGIAPRDVVVPDVDAAGAEELGRQAFEENRPITDNPFPFGDKRQQRWDKGWRNASGSDGMGPSGGAGSGGQAPGGSPPGGQ